MSSISRIVVAVSALVIFISDTHAATTAQIESARNRGLAWLISHQQVDGGWKDAPGGEVAATSQVLAALRGAGIVKGFPYVKGLTWLGNVDAGSVDSLTRKITALKAAGMDVSLYVNQLMQWRNASNHTSWGAYDRFTTSFPDTPLALRALRDANYSYPGMADEIKRTVFCDIVWSQGLNFAPLSATTGGWSYIGWPEALDAYTPVSLVRQAIYPTVINTFELLAQRTAYPAWDVAGQTCDESRTISGTAWVAPTFSTWGPLTTAINNGFTYVNNLRNTGGAANNIGGFGANGVSVVMDTAFASYLYAPASVVGLGIQDYFLNNQLPDGSWSGNTFLTAAVIGALAAALPSPTLVDTDSDGIPDAIEALLGTNPLIFDSRYLAN